MTRHFKSFLAIYAAIIVVAVIGVVALPQSPPVPNYGEMLIERATIGRCGDAIKVWELYGTILGDTEHEYRLYFAPHLKDPKPFLINKQDAKTGKMVEGWAFGEYHTSEYLISTYGIVGAICRILEGVKI